MLTSTIRAIGTAVPEFQGTQTQVARWAVNVLAANGDDGGEPNRTRRSGRGAIERIYGRSGIVTRQSVVPDYATEPEGFALYPRNWRLEPQPSTAARMELYRREAPRLAARAATRCLTDAGTAADTVTHLVVVSCTGFFAPGLDAHLVRALGLRPDVQRLCIGFMGCHAAFNALRTADALCRDRDDACVLVVCVELCTLHFQRDPTLNDIVANSLFSDGAAALLLAQGVTDEGRLQLLDSTTRLDRDSEHQMTWTIGDTGFRMMLGPEVPNTLMDTVGPFVDELLARNGAHRDDVGFWAIHPGGRRIVEVVRDRLGLTAAEAAPSFAVLAEHGNMSSPTIAFVLERVLRDRPSAGTLGVALAFGPGLTLESALLRVG